MPETSKRKRSVVLLISCPDRKGLVAVISDFIFRHNGNILHADEHRDEETNLFLMRVEFDPSGLDVDLKELATEFSAIAEQFQMRWRLANGKRRPRMGILVSKYDHCLADLLYRHKAGELDCDIPIVLSNHTATERLAGFYGAKFVCLPMTRETKAEVEQKQIAMLREHECDLVVLARYMQVLSPKFLAEFPNQIINIHHSFLPAFVGARPYHQAFERGVKLIGATSHYVTEVLDDGPIIEQAVVRISHRDSVEDLIHKGRDLEKVVLSRAVGWHLENRVLLYGNKTVVFD
ncbi:MAG: formyltetrahydrofolate deformylase [Acidobacteria bacterium]|nr:MAG: formyltetrahydrofolate deformylase [Acidobacteriota bacterium]